MHSVPRFVFSPQDPLVRLSRKHRYYTKDLSRTGKRTSKGSRVLQPLIPLFQFALRPCGGLSNRHFPFFDPQFASCGQEFLTLCILSVVALADFSIFPFARTNSSMNITAPCSRVIPYVRNLFLASLSRSSSSSTLSATRSLRRQAYSICGSYVTA